MSTEEECGLCLSPATKPHEEQKCKKLPPCPVIDSYTRLCALLTYHFYILALYFSISTSRFTNADDLKSNLPNSMM